MASEEVKYIELVTWNKELILMHGDKLTRTQTAIGLRSNGLHTEIRYSDRYGHIWWSCTLADDCGCCRFKAINRSHPYRQSVVRIYVTAEQEEKLFCESCWMADIPDNYLAAHLMLEPQQVIAEGYAENGCYYGPNAIKYDKWGARISFVSRKVNWWKMHPDKMICNEACANVLLVEWPDILVTDPEYFFKGQGCGIAPQNIIDSYDQKQPSDLTPEQFEYLVRNYFDNGL